MRCGLLVLLVGLSPALAEDRPCQHLLSPVAAQRVDALQAELQTALAAGDLAGVRTRAAEVRKLHAGLPAGHWQRRSGEHLAGTFEKLANAGDTPRKDFADALAVLRQAEAAWTAGKYADAEPAFARATTLQQALFPAPSHALADTQRKIASTLLDAGKLPQARAAAEESLKMMQQVWGDHPWTARGHLLLADVLARLPDQAEAAEYHARRGWEIARFCLGPSADLTEGARRSLQKLLAEHDKLLQAELVERLHLLDTLELGLGPTHRDTVAACQSVAEALDALGEGAAAETLHRRALAQQQANNAEAPAVVATMQRLVLNLIRQNKGAEAEAVARKLVEAQAARGEADPDTPTAWMILAEAHFAVPRPDAGLEALNKALTLRRKQHGEAHAATVTAYNRLGNALDDLGRHAEAEPYYRKALELGVLVAGAQSGNAAILRGNLGTCLLHQGKLDEADKCLAEASDVLHRLEGLPSVGSAAALLNLASVQLARKKYDAALALYLRAHEAVQRTAGDKHPMMARVLGCMGGVLQQLGKLDQAEVVLTQAVALQRRGAGAETAGCAEAQTDLAECLLRRGKLADAEKLARASSTTLAKVAPGSPGLALALAVLGRVLDASKPADGEACHRQALKVLEARATPIRRQGKILAALGANLHRQKRDAEAEPLLRKSLAALDQDPLTLDLDRQDLLRTLSETLTALGKAEEARQLAEKPQ